jgi:hypothetical protein
MSKMTLMEQLRIWFKQKTNVRFAYIAGSLILGVGAVVLGFTTGGLGFVAYILLGLAIVGLIQAVVELSYQLKKDHGPKINRDLYVHENGDEFQISPMSEHFLLGDKHQELKNCYLAFKDTKKLYYVNSAGQAHRVDVNDDFCFNLSLGIHKPDEKLNQLIRANVDEPDLSKKRKIWKGILLTLALLLAIGGLVTGIPVLDSSIALELGMIIGGLVVAILSPLVGAFIAWTKHYFHVEPMPICTVTKETPNCETESRLIHTLGAEPQVEQQVNITPDKTTNLFEKTPETQALLDEDEVETEGDTKNEENSAHL